LAFYLWLLAFLAVGCWLFAFGFLPLAVGLWLLAVAKS